MQIKDYYVAKVLFILHRSYNFTGTFNSLPHDSDYLGTLANRHRESNEDMAKQKNKWKNNSLALAF